MVNVVSTRTPCADQQIVPLMLSVSATPAQFPAQCECAQYPGACWTVLHKIWVKLLVEDSTVTIRKVQPLVSSLCFLSDKLLLNECCTFQVVSGAALTEMLKYNKSVYPGYISTTMTCWKMKRCYCQTVIFLITCTVPGVCHVVWSQLGELASWAKTFLLSAWRCRNTAWL